MGAGVKKMDPISEEIIVELKLQNETMRKDMVNMNQKMNQVLDIMKQIKSHIGIADEQDHSSESDLWNKAWKLWSVKSPIFIRIVHFDSFGTSFFFASNWSKKYKIGNDAYLCLTSNDIK